MPPGRIAVVTALFAFLIQGHACAILEQRELWPFSPYRLYTDIPGSEIRAVQIFGILADGSEVLLESDHLRPFDISRVQFYMRRIRAVGREAAMGALFTLVDVYEERRLRGAHDGPPIVGLRAYSLVWDADPAAANIGAPRERQVLFGGTKLRQAP